MKFLRISFPVLMVIISFSSCRTVSRVPVELVGITGSKIEMNTEWDVNPDPEAVAVLDTYKSRIDRIMTEVIGESEMGMISRKPESLLSNLITDVLRESTVPYIGKPADMALMNMGGLRTSLNKGTITTGNIYEILPFENHLCILTLKGSDLVKLMENIAFARGEGVSNVKLEITEDGKLSSAFIGGEPIDVDRMYTVATIDYLSEGNDKMTALLLAQSKQCYEKATIRDIFLSYIRKQTAEGKKIGAEIDNRITVKP